METIYGNPHIHSLKFSLSKSRSIIYGKYGNIFMVRSKSRSISWRWLSIYGGFKVKVFLRAHHFFLLSWARATSNRHLRRVGQLHAQHDMDIHQSTGIWIVIHTSSCMYIYIMYVYIYIHIYHILYICIYTHISIGFYGTGTRPFASLLTWSHPTARHDRKNKVTPQHPEVTPPLVNHHGKVSLFINFLWTREWGTVRNGTQHLQTVIFRV